MYPEKEEIRQRIKYLREKDPGKSIRGIAAELKCNKAVVEHTVKKLNAGLPLSDAPRSGRPRSLQGTALDTALSLGLQSSSASSKTIAETLKQQGLADVSPSTISRTLRGSGCQYGPPRKVPLLTQKHKQTRVSFAVKHTDLKTDFRKVMFTDSKIFCLSSLGGKRWYLKGARPEVPMPKNPTKVHVYLGVTYYGPTRPVFVTGGGSQKSSFCNTRTGKPLQGVGSQEYVENVLPVFLEDGNRLFSSNRCYSGKWILQQDNAPAHTAKLTKSFLENRMQGRMLDDWPPCSPDLSWIENVWAWLDRKLDRYRSQLRTAQDLRNAVKEVIELLPTDFCANYVNGIQYRLQKVKSGGGKVIGK